MTGDKPILFSTAMVQAILDGRKTMTRRVIKPQPPEDFYWAAKDGIYDPVSKYVKKCPYQVGMTLWVRETFYGYGKWIKNGLSKTGKLKWKFISIDRPNCKTFRYFDNPPKNILKNKQRIEGWYKRPSIFMPKSAARIFLKVTDIRVERVQDIETNDIEKEGVMSNLNPDGFDYYANMTHKWINLWDSINKDRGYGWNTNCFVWVYTFKRIKP
jgi:hypothetical protein